MRLRAVKPLTYATRRLLPGDVFETVRDRDARILIATRKVEAVRGEAPVPPPPPAVAEKIAAAIAPVAPVEPAAGAMSTADVGLVAEPADDLAVARADYEAALGRRPFHGWSAYTLRQKIAAAKGA